MGGRKNVVKSFKMIDAGDISSNITSHTVNVINLDNASIHVEWAGAAINGTMVVQAKNGESDSWYDLDMGGVISLTGAGGDHQLVFNSLPFTDIRLVYTATAGTGTLDAKISAKVVGA